MLTHTHTAVVIALACAAAALPAQALQWDWNGELQSHKDVFHIDLRLDQALDKVGLWTDSFENGVNFDPILGLWGATGDGDWRLLAQNDDCDCVVPGQTYFDSGLRLLRLDAGDYKVTVTQFSNFATGTLLSQGHWRDAADPQPLGTGPVWRVHMADGMDFDVPPPPPPPPIPEPGSVALLLAGLGGLAAWIRRRPGAGTGSGAPA